MHWCPYLNFRASPPVNILMKCACEEEQKWMKSVVVCGDMCVPGKNKIKPSDSRRVWVSEWESCVWRMGYCRAGGGKLATCSHDRLWPSLLSLALCLSLPLSPSLFLTLSFRLPFLPCDRSTGSFQKRRGRLTIVKTVLGAALSALMLVTGRWRSKTSGASMEMQIRHCWGNMPGNYSRLSLA